MLGLEDPMTLKLALMWEEQIHKCCLVYTFVGNIMRKMIDVCSDISRNLSFRSRFILRIMITCKISLMLGLEDPMTLKLALMWEE
jgi:hypothetical protein